MDLSPLVVTGHLAVGDYHLWVRCKIGRLVGYSFGTVKNWHLSSLQAAFRAILLWPAFIPVQLCLSKRLVKDTPLLKGKEIT